MSREYFKEYFITRTLYKSLSQGLSVLSPSFQFIY